jgi:predicted DNA-binding transcriptional regulator AlpA
MPKKEYLTIEETAQAIGVKRSSVYHYLKHLGIKPQKFKLNRNKYISAVDVERIKQAKAEPWKYEKGDKTI